MDPMDEASLSELERFCQEIREVFTDAPEFDTIREINHYLAQIENNFHTRQTSYVQTMTELNQNINKLQKESSSLGSSDFQSKKRDLEEKKIRCEEKIAQLSRDRVQTMQAIEKYRAQCADLEKTVESYEVESSDDIPRFRHALDLYELLSSIKWTYEAPPQLVSGTVYSAERSKKFEFNKDTMSQFELSNKIWELLDC